MHTHVPVPLTQQPIMFSPPCAVTPPPTNIIRPKAQHFRVHGINMFEHAVNHLTATFPHQIPRTFQLHSVNIVLNPLTRKDAWIKQLISGFIEGQDSKTCYNALAHEIGRLSQDYDTTKGTNNFLFIPISSIQNGKKKSLSLALFGLSKKKRQTNIG